MEGKVPVPTDNIFKFYALFSLVVFVFSIGALLYTNNTTNDRILSTAVEIEKLKQEEAPTKAQLTQIAALERQLEITVSDKPFYRNALAVIFALACLGMWYGFWKWHHEVQPRIDEMANVQLEIAKLQLEQLRRVASPATPASPPVPTRDDEARP